MGLLSMTAYLANNIKEKLISSMHTATPSGRFCGRKWTRSGASGQFS